MNSTLTGGLVLTSRMTKHDRWEGVVSPNISSLFRCFEVNKCPGLYWDGTPVCSAEKIKQVRRDKIFFIF